MTLEMGNSLYLGKKKKSFTKSQTSILYQLNSQELHFALKTFSDGYIEQHCVQAMINMQGTHFWCMFSHQMSTELVSIKICQEAHLVRHCKVSKIRKLSQNIFFFSSMKKVFEVVSHQS